MKPTVYVETTIISYLTAWPSRDIVLLGQQQLTREWWDARDRFDLVCSELVEREASAGDAAAAAARMTVIGSIPMLSLTPDAATLAAHIISVSRLPRRAHSDALHVAIAAVNGIEQLVTWNCRHLTNANFRPKIEQACRDRGLVPPTICTPPDLMENTL